MKSPEFTEEASFNHTENPVDIYKRDCAEVVILPNRETTWRIHGCKQHLEEFVAANKLLGDTSKFVWFEDGVGRFCPVCWDILHYRRFDKTFQVQTAFKKE